MKALLQDLVKIVGVRVSVRISGSGVPLRLLGQPVLSAMHLPELSCFMDLS